MGNHPTKMQQVVTKQQKILKITDDFYKFEDQNAFLGKGAYGEVRKGYSKSRNKIVAIKTIQKLKYDSRQVQTLQTLCSLKHPNIVEFYDYYITNKQVFMFLQYCPEGTLREKIEKGLPKGLSQLQVLIIFRQIVEGACYINAKGKIHRDLKPENILIGEDQKIKINDFGLAKTNEGINQSGAKGTPLYIAPQVAKNSQRQNEKCDVWSCGLILYQMLTGQMLFKNVIAAKIDKGEAITLLYNNWSLFQSGAKRVEYPKSFYPLWQHLTNIMLTYDPSKRPTFHKVLQVLKKSYSKLQRQISGNNVQQIQNSRLNSLQNFMTFEAQKYQILLSVLQKSIMPSSQHIGITMKFLIVAKYLTHMERLIRKLEQHSLTLPGSYQSLIKNQQRDWEIALCMDRHCNIFDNKYLFRCGRLKQIMRKILEDHCRESRYQAYFEEISQIKQLIVNTSKGIFYEENTYTERLKQIVLRYYLPENDQLQDLGLDQLKLLTKILVITQLDSHLPANQYDRLNFVDQKITGMLSKDKPQLIQQVQMLRKSIQ